MARTPQITHEILTPLIRARGPVSATELAAVLRVNRTTIARCLRDFGEDLVTLGATRSTRYLLRRSVRNIGSRWPVFRIDGDGRASEWAELEALHERSWRVNWAGTPPEWAGMLMENNGLWSGFPFFLGDLRPQGFLGRLIATRISRMLLLPEDPRRWSDEDVLVFLLSAGEDVPGNLVLGGQALRRALAGAADLPTGRCIGDDEREAFYPSQAGELSRNLPGSSAGGEQPKFLATLQTHVGYRAVLVKFTAPMEQQTGRRWADLLACEFHAHQVLAEAGLSQPGARLIDAGGRRFLEIPRFDRHGASGRTGVVSLEAALSAASVGLARDWNMAAGELHRRGWIDSGSITTIQTLQAFGELIGNSDMHSANLAFFLGDSLPLQVTPSYDMLPMQWAPGPQGEIVDRPFAPAPPAPAWLEPWRNAARMAQDFWDRVSGDSRISPEFRRTTGEAGGVVRQLHSHVG